MTDIPAWIAPLADRVRAVKLPTAQLSDAMREHGEDPRDDALWVVRIGQLDIALFGRPARDLRETPIGLRCPECGEEPGFLIGGQQAFCDTVGCRILKWDPTQTRAEMLAEGIQEIDLGGERQ